MPIYEYRRPDGSTFEVVQSFSEDPLTHDPDTGAPVKRVLHPPAVHFKGKGFYNTDYGTRKRQRENAAASGEESKKSESGAGEGAKSPAGEGSGAPNGSDARSDGKPAGPSTDGAKSATKSKGRKPVAASG
jgi:putative FmdB family regulatory protein